MKVVLVLIDCSLIVVQADFRWQHIVYGPRKGTKNTNYPALLFLVLKRSVDDRRQFKMSLI